MALQRVISIGTTAQRPSDPQPGWLHYNTDNGALEIFQSAVWSPSAGATGGVLLMGRVTAGGGINLNVSGQGASFSVSKPSTGTYDITLTGITGNIVVAVAMNSSDGQGGAIRPSPVPGGLTARNTDLESYPTNTGFRYKVIRYFHDSCGGCPYMDGTFTDEPFSFIVYQA